ncbi:hypothetical protein PP740_gp064 [Stenotrophomonas phage Philippe]|uniref:Uncharacterized protein n=1 Tax=Stenotrophomonas phage Philippe TaxID=2859655 RepID=A0AAE8BLQ4_9CAUD|nr:hypothetical protein PP740_gp064 [Stenotrophomonas phage Philippe]QYW02278.1 hypothetical protein CPT_Philippe_085 [Stenotrophomonas phage Philippe]
MSEVITEPTRIEQMERSLENAKQAALDLQAFERLMANRDFRDIVLNKFMVTECARYAQQSGNVMLTEQQRADALCMAQAAGHLKSFLHVYSTQLATKAGSVEGLETDLEQMRQEESEEQEG